MRSFEEYRQRIAEVLEVHPRVAFQKLASTVEEKQAFSGAVPDLVPFKGNEYQGFLPILDWDHRLPSKDLILRIYTYYTVDSLALGKADYLARMEQIQKLDRYPEFDVPDFGHMVADEAYEVAVDLMGSPMASRLTSAWRRELDGRDAARAVATVRQSKEFNELKRKLRNRPEILGDAEAVSWTPPCESGYKRWTMDVWYMMTYDGMFGKGRSFLVDLEAKRVVAIREFTVRPD